LTGKFFVGLVAAAFSSASAATVGVVYTTVIHTTRIDVASTAGETAPISAPVKTAVVLSANDSYFNSVKDSPPDTASSVCSGGDDAQRCVVVARASDVRLKILGYTLTLPPIWLGGDSQDAYSGDGQLSSLLSELAPSLEVAVHAKRRHGLVTGITSPDGTDGQFGPQSEGGSASRGNDSQTASQNSPSQNSSGGTGDSQPVEFEITSSAFSDFASELGKSSPHDPLRALSPVDSGPPADPLVSSPLDPPLSSPSSPDPVSTGLSVQLSPTTSPGVGPAAPEPSTWVMTILGFAALGLFRRRQIAAALRSMKGSRTPATGDGGAPDLKAQRRSPCPPLSALPESPQAR
jgi:hypothetical protein